MQRLFRIDDISELKMPANYWSAPQNNPPAVLAAQASVQ
jgi:hypothetical protein